MEIRIDVLGVGVAGLLVLVGASAAAVLHRPDQPVPPLDTDRVEAEIERDLYSRIDVLCAAAEQRDGVVSECQGFNDDGGAFRILVRQTGDAGAITYRTMVDEAHVPLPGSPPG